MTSRTSHHDVNVPYFWDPIRWLLAMWLQSTQNAANMGPELNISFQQMCGFCRGQHCSRVWAI